MAAVNCFTNTFAVDASRLVNLALGATAAQNVKDDACPECREDGKRQKDKFLQERLQTQNKNFIGSVKQNELNTMFLSSKRVKLKSASNKYRVHFEKYQRSVFIFCQKATSSSDQTPTMKPL